MHVIALFALEALAFIALEIYRLAYLSEWRCRQRMPQNGGINPLSEPAGRDARVYVAAGILAALAVITSAIVEKV